MINILVLNKSNIKNKEIDIVKKICFFQIRKFSEYRSISTFFTKDSSSQVAIKRKEKSDLVLVNDFVEANQDEQYIKITYSHDDNKTSDLLIRIKNLLGSCNVIPNNIDIETIDSISPSDCFLTFEYHIYNNNWLYNDVALDVLTSLQIDTINSFSSLFVNKCLILGNSQADIFTDNNEYNISVMAKLIKKQLQGTGILPSVSIAQFIFESGYGKSELCKKANNCFGIKASSPQDKWFNTTWDEGMIYRKETTEYTPNGLEIKYTFNFRKYNSVEESIADYISYLLNRTNGSHLRYEGIDECKNYKEACHILNLGHYSTNQEYEMSLIDIIERFDLTKYDEGEIE